MGPAQSAVAPEFINLLISSVVACGLGQPGLNVPDRKISNNKL